VTGGQAVVDLGHDLSSQLTLGVAACRLHDYCNYATYAGTFRKARSSVPATTARIGKRV
jgi:hypothetical protein